MSWCLCLFELLIYMFIFALRLLIVDCSSTEVKGVRNSSSLGTNNKETGQQGGFLEKPSRTNKKNLLKCKQNNQWWSQTVAST